MAFPRETKTEPEAPVFCAVLRPHRSLDARARALVVALAAAGGIVVTVPFFLLGAWPVLGFMGLDVVLVWLALRINSAEARNEEQIFLTRAALVIRRLDWRGAFCELIFNPRWSRLEREEHPEWGLERLSVVQGRARTVVGACLGREERADFAEAFARALARARA